jgi:hypothetical protein
LKSDQDYNDIIFHVKGAKGQAHSLDELINAKKDWRTTDHGMRLIDYVEAIDFDDVDGEELDGDTDGGAEGGTDPGTGTGSTEGTEQSMDNGGNSGTDHGTGTGSTGSTGQPTDNGGGSGTDHGTGTGSSSGGGQPDSSSGGSGTSGGQDSSGGVIGGGSGTGFNPGRGSSPEFPAAQQPLVGIIDTGFAPNNPDIDYTHILLGHDYVGQDADPFLATGEGSQHGTHILGIIKATQGNGIGIDGVNDDAHVWISRATGSGHWADALKEFVDTAKLSGQPNAIANLSFDLTQTDADGNVFTRYELINSEQEALAYAHQNGVLIVAAAGNQGSTMSALGKAAQSFDNILVVGAADGDHRAYYSSYGSGLGIMAPGGTFEQPIVSTSGQGVDTAMGTSAATAQVTGAVSQVWAANPDLNYTQVIDILKATATDIQASRWDIETGAGLLNLAAAVNLAKITMPEPYIPSGTSLPPELWIDWQEFSPLERVTDSSSLGENFEKDFAHEFEPLSPDVEPEEDGLPGGAGGGSSGGGNPGGGYGTDNIDPPNDTSDWVNPNPHITEIPLEYFEQAGTIHGYYFGLAHHNHFMTLPGDWVTLRENEEPIYIPPAFLIYAGTNLINGEEVPKYRRAFILFDNAEYNFWRSIDLNNQTVSTEEDRAHYRAAQQVYEEKYDEKFKEKFPEHSTVRRDPSLPPPPNPGGGSSSPSFLSYLDALRRLIGYSTNQLEAGSSRSNELQSQLDSFISIGHVVEEQEIFNSFGGNLLGGLYFYAHNITADDIEGRGEEFHNWLSRQDDNPLDTLRYPAGLIAAASLVPDLKERLVSETFTNILISLGRNFSSLASSFTSGLSDATRSLFLNALGNNQNSSSIQQSASELGEFIEDFDDPSQVLKFTNYILQAVKQSTELGDLKRNPDFILELTETAKAYAALNPPGAKDNKGGSFLDTLWSISKQKSLYDEVAHDAVIQLDEFFHGLPDPIHALKLQQALLKAMKETETNSGLTHLAFYRSDRTFLHNLIGIGQAYASLNPSVISETGGEPLKFFLDTLWHDQSEASIKLAADELNTFTLNTFIQGSDPSSPIYEEGSASPSELLTYGRRLIKIAKYVPGLDEKDKRDFLSRLVNLGKTYQLFKLDPYPFPRLPPLESDQDLEMFLHTLNKATDINDAADSVKEFSQFLTGLDQPKSVLEFSDNLLQSARGFTEWSGMQQAPTFSANLVELGRNYILLNPGTAMRVEGSEGFFLNTLWTAQRIKEEQVLNSPSWDVLKSEQQQAIDQARQEFFEFAPQFASGYQGEIFDRYIDFSGDLLDLARQVPKLDSVIHPKFIRKLLEDGARYSDLQFQNESGFLEKPDSSFLNQLWHKDTSGAALQGAIQYLDLIPGTPDGATIRYALRLLMAQEQVSLQSTDDMAVDLAPQLAQLASAYTALKPDSDWGDLGFFLDSVWSTESTVAPNSAGIASGATELKEFLVGGGRQFNTGFRTEDQPRVLEFIAQILQATAITNGLTPDEKQKPDFLKALVNLGRTYADTRLPESLDDGTPPSSGSEIADLFLDTLWDGNQSISRVAEEFASFLNAFEVLSDVEGGLQYVNKIDQMNYVGKLLLAIKIAIGNADEATSAASHLEIRVGKLA